MSATIHKIETTTNPQIDYADVTLDASYPTGGYNLAAILGDEGEKVVLALAEDHGDYAFRVNRATKKLMAYQNPTGSTAGALTEVANATDLHTITVRVVVIRHLYAA